MEKPNQHNTSELTRRVMLQAGALALIPVTVQAGGASLFNLKYEAGRISSLRYAHDTFDTDYVMPGQRLGDVRLSYRHPGEDWRLTDTVGLSPDISGAFDILTGNERAFSVHSALKAAGDKIQWTISLRNSGSRPIEIGDLGIPLPMDTDFKADRAPTASVLKHSFVSGDSSFLFWMRSNSVGPYLMMTPVPGTRLEYWDRLPKEKGHPTYCTYIHSSSAGAVAASKGCNWRQPHTSLSLAAGEEKTYGFELSWAKDYDDVRDKIVTAGLVDTVVAPGMTVPTDLSTQIAFRTREPIHGVEAEYPEATRIEKLGIRDGRHIFKATFSKLGENRLTLKHGDNRTTYLEFFVTEPIEVLIKKRGAFIAAHQHRDKNKWYNGLLAEWNMESQVLLGPDNYDLIKGWRIYEVTCDDPGLAKPAYLAAKNAEYPVQDEITALDDYIEHFVWGGLQRTTDEKYSFGLYGIPDWKTLRESADPGPKGQTHIWRPYDYPHIFAMYLSMYSIAKAYGHMNTRLTADEYLQRAAGTAIAMFNVPLETGNWSAYETGFYNELVIPNLIDALTVAGKTDQAQQLRTHWERKVAFFVKDNPNLFGSEYAFDSTGFESTQAFARYAIDNAKPGDAISLKEAHRFSDIQMKANLFCRGIIEPAYYYLGSDYRQNAGDSFTLTYMSQMGGWAVMDYALHDAADPHAYLRSGYASYLSAWALMNTGTADSNYGYWYPGEGNDGAAGGGFEPAPYGTTWLDQPHHRGSWYYSCEVDLGFCGALRSAATILADDPIFGRICYGGEWHNTKTGVAIIPKDGVRRRFHGRLKDQSLSLILNKDRFATAQEIEWNGERGVRFILESDNPAAHTTSLKVSGLSDGNYAVSGDPTIYTVKNGNDLDIKLAVIGSLASYSLQMV